MITLNIKPATGKNLDRIANEYGLKRVKYFWIFKESDKSLRNRVKTFLRGQPWKSNYEN